MFGISTDNLRIVRGSPFSLTQTLLSSFRHHIADSFHWSRPRRKLIPEKGAGVRRFFDHCVKLSTDPPHCGRYAGTQQVSSSLNREPLPANQHSQCARATRGGLIRGQAALEFALVLSVGLMILVVAVQMALIGETVLALGQVNYQGARYAAVHQCATASDVAAYMVSVASPTLVGSNCGANMTVTLTDVYGTNSSSGSCGTPGCEGTPRTFGSQVTVSVAYTIPSSQMFLPNPFLGISFPTQLSSTEASMSE